MLTLFESLAAKLNSVFSSDEEGQGMIEYGLLVALISIAAIAVIVLIGPQIGNLFQTVMNNL